MNQTSDLFFRLKYMGYCMSQMPPEGVDADFDDFIRYAKFQLCRVNNILMKDPVWNNYNDEEILIEYYATLYHNSEDERSKVETSFAGNSEDVVEWFDKMIAENQKRLKDLEKISEEAEDEISFNPETLGD